MSIGDIPRMATIGNAFISLVPEANRKVHSFDTPEVDSVRLAILTELVGDVAHAHMNGTGQLEDYLVRAGGAVMEWLNDLGREQAR